MVILVCKCMLWIGSDFPSPLYLQYSIYPGAVTCHRHYEPSYDSVYSCGCLPYQNWEDRGSSGGMVMAHKTCHVEPGFPVPARGECRYCTSILDPTVLPQREILTPQLDLMSGLLMLLAAQNSSAVDQTPRFPWVTLHSHMFRIAQWLRRRHQQD